MKHPTEKYADPDNSFIYADQICPNCESKGLLLFLELRNVPLDCTSIMSTKTEALASPRGDIILGLCENCSFITNVAFNQRIVDDSIIYEDQQGFSPTFKTYIEKLADYLIKKYNLSEKTIIEIGCGKGDFLELLCKLGNNRGIGIDPLSDEKRIGPGIANQITLIKELYSEKHGRYHGDLLCCRHTLEHVPQTAEFLKTVRKSLGDRLHTILFFEVPDVSRIIDELAFWDIYYEHCSYFSPGSLARLFRNCGFEIIDLKRDYDDQYLLLEAKAVAVSSQKKSEIEESPEFMVQQVKSFSTHFKNMVNFWGRYLQHTHGSGKRAVIWGSGSKCVSFLSATSISDEIEYVVDINPHRQGFYVAGTGQHIVDPVFLKKYKPDIVIVMNKIYLEEIEQDLQGMNLTTEILTLGDFDVSNHGSI